ncbi:MAG: hypothetical protein ACLR6I_11555 [Waltera sp.]
MITGNMPSLICMIKTENVFIPRHREMPRTDLPVYWGILKAVEDSKENAGVCGVQIPNDSRDFDCMQQETVWEETVYLEGYIVISMRAENFEKVLHDNGNSQGGGSIYGSLSGEPFMKVVTCRQIRSVKN